MNSSPSAMDALSEFINFYSKTRTIPAYIALLLECLSNDSSKELSNTNDSPCNLLREYVSGVVLSAPHLEALARACQTFITPGQTPDVASLLIVSLERVWKYFNDANADMMDVDGGANSGRKDPDRSAVRLSITRVDQSAFAYAMTARVVGALLPSLPFTSLTMSTLSAIKARVTQMRSGPVQEAIVLLDESEVDSIEWTNQAVGAAALRVCHTLVMCRPLLCDDLLDGRGLLLRKAAKFIGSKQTIPELVIELVRQPSITSGLPHPDMLLY